MSCVFKKKMVVPYPSWIAGYIGYLIHLLLFWNSAENVLDTLAAVLRKQASI